MSDCVGDVIIIDDDSGVLEVLEIYCENLSCFRNIIKARDGSEASKKLRNQEFALILLDVNMPKKSGVDILRELHDKDHPNDIKNVIIVSGELNKMVLTVSVERGVKNFLVKPFDEDQFREKIKPILNLL
jgi:response regulator of citrate/malate metabolism